LRKRDPPQRRSPRRRSSRRILVVDIGGSAVKMLATGHSEPRKMASGPELTPTRLVDGVRKACRDWKYDVVSIGYPGLVGAHGPRSEPGNLGHGWVGFNFAAAFGCPVRIINDAAMQALGSYDGGRMLFLGLGTGVGSALVAQSVIVPLELGELPLHGRRPLGDTLGDSGLARDGKRAWRKRVARAVAALTSAFAVDSVVLGGGNARRIKKLAAGMRLGSNQAAFRGGFRLWRVPDVPTLSADGEAPPTPAAEPEWRVL
jgi:predicted NBD/HSP70 family sugar kinase